jgi:hypothetical protein
MNNNRTNLLLEWGGRIVGGIIVAAIVYFSISYISTWDKLPQEMRLGISGFIGALFIMFGKFIWSWIDAITDWT